MKLKTELYHLRRHYFITRKDLIAATKLNMTTFSHLENGHLPLGIKLCHSFVDGYRKLGFKNAVWALYDIYKRGNPFVKEEDLYDEDDGDFGMVREELRLAVNRTAQRISQPDTISEETLPRGI